MEHITQFLSHFLEPNPQTALLIVLNLILIESLLSVDNAAVLATMVMDLPEKDRRRALRIGLVLAYVFRGTALYFANVLIHINWLKLVGGGYLIFLCLQFFYKRLTTRKDILEIEQEELPPEVKHPRRVIPGLSHFWSTVLMVEMMDLTFSLDNVFAAVAFTDNIYLVCLGVFIGIVTMRVVAGYFVKLMERFPFLDAVAFVVIGILGLKLCLGFYCGHYGPNEFCEMAESERADMFFSLGTVLIFVSPILSSLLLGYPRRGHKHRFK
ncbi:MAG: DUF475 domain-containing protein [Chitinophagales bacterium]|nr:DUF475 domain-containing protein [Chitinophagales bacterium]MDW8417993.1 DUF475 domain-containing protein [Chitinophagales bacterium]